MSENIKELDEQAFKSELEKSNLPVLVDFFAVWCGPCKNQTPILENLAKELTGKLSIAKVDIDKSSNLAANLGIMSVPTLILYQGGREVNRWIGLTPVDTIKKKLGEVAEKKK